MAGFGTPTPTLLKDQLYFKNQYMLCIYCILSPVLDTEDRNMNMILSSHEVMAEGGGRQLTKQL